MSWYAIDDIDLEAKITWTCPRCGKRQSISVKDEDEVFCQNIEICGNRQVFFSLNITGTQKGLSDKPLIQIYVVS